MYIYIYIYISLCVGISDICMSRVCTPPPVPPWYGPQALTSCILQNHWYFIWNIRMSFEMLVFSINGNIGISHLTGADLSWWAMAPTRPLHCGPVELSGGMTPSWIFIVFPSIFSWFLSIIDSSSSRFPKACYGRVVKDRHGLSKFIKAHQGPPGLVKAQNIVIPIEYHWFIETQSPNNLFEHNVLPMKQQWLVDTQLPKFSYLLKTFCIPDCIFMTYENTTTHNSDIHWNTLYFQWYINDLLKRKFSQFKHLLKGIIYQWDNNVCFC